MQLDTLDGSGVLVIAKAEVGPVNYAIDVSWNGRNVIGKGVMGGHRSILVQASKASDVQLRTPEGDINLLIERLGDDGCFFETWGIIPGVDTGDL